MYVLVVTLNDDAYNRFRGAVLSNPGSEMNVTMDRKVIYRFTIDETVLSMGAWEPENTFQILRLRADSKAQALHFKAYLDVGR